MEFFCADLVMDTKNGNKHESIYKLSSSRVCVMRCELWHLYINSFFSFIAIRLHLINSTIIDYVTFCHRSIEHVFLLKSIIFKQIPMIVSANRISTWILQYYYHRHLWSLKCPCFENHLTINIKWPEFTTILIWCFEKFHYTLAQHRRCV